MPRKGGSRVAFVSCNATPWGGSEELWSRAALELLEQDIEVAVAKPNINRSVEPIAALKLKGAKMVDLANIWLVPGKLISLLNFALRPVMAAWQLVLLWIFLKRSRADLVVLSQGGCWDGFYMEPVLARVGIPYVLVCQKASDLYWPSDHLRPRIKRFALNARHIFFVSHHNHQLMQEQIGAPIPHGSVVRNPFLVDYNAPRPWPAEDAPIRLACIGRLYPMEKGQDILLRVLAQPKWKERPVEVDFYGSGINDQGLQDMAALLGCDNVTFCGHTDSIDKVWDTHHGLVLPSRAEGLPLVLIEAMLAGRVAIISRAGGSAEIIEDGETAFLMDGYYEAGLDAALERAWQLRADWQDIGAKAAIAVREQVPANPAAELAQLILKHLPQQFPRDELSG